MHEYILVYARDKSKVNEILMPRPEEEKIKFTRTDEHFKDRGKYYIRPLKSNLEERLTLVYPIKTPDGNSVETQWLVSEKTFQELLEDDRIEFVKRKDGTYQICKKYYETDGEGKVKVPSLIEKFPNTEGKFELKRIFGIKEGRDNVFYTVKPLNLIKYLIRPYLNRNDLVLDSFAGTGTTGHAVLEINKQDGGNRQFILVEMETDICNKITYHRLKSAINGYSYNGNNVEGLGGGFRYCKLDKPLFDETGRIGESVKFADLAAHIFFTETGMPIPKRANGTSPFLGTANGTGYYLLFNGILGDKTPDGGNVLTGKVLASLPKHNGPKIIFGEGCRLGRTRLRREQITFKQIPYEIKVS
jgi:site-specific DNA-methyltransferase (adenine-specific)/adenine-specific DNA-methyltransferase